MEQRLNRGTIMKNLASAELEFIHAGGEPFHVDVGQFIGAYAKSVTENTYFGPLTGTVAFFEALAYALKD